MSVTVDNVSTRAFQDPEKFLDRTGKERNARIVPAHFCYMRFINNCHYLHVDKFAGIQRHTLPRKNNLSFVQMFSADSPFELKDYWKISVKAFQNIDVGEEFYIDYGIAYYFP